MLSNLSQREVFHIIFLRHLARQIKPNIYALKGGCNLRFFFGSIRYSEDMDLDIKEIAVHKLQDVVLNILSSVSFSTLLRAYQIERIVPPNMKTAKQTETVQRFKIHLINSAGEDLFTKIEFSRRGIESDVLTESIDTSVLHRYHLPPLIISHYSSHMAISQKISALAGRATPQARDVFDIYALSPRIDNVALAKILKGFSSAKIKTAHDNLFAMSFGEFKDTVCSYLTDEDMNTYANPDVWDDIQLKVSEIIEGVKK